LRSPPGFDDKTPPVPSDESDRDMSPGVSTKSAHALARAIGRSFLRLWPYVILYFFATYVAVLVYQYVTNTIDEPADFTAFFAVGTLSSDGRAEDAYSRAAIDETVLALFPETDKRFYWFYPPYYNILLEFFSMFSYTTAFLLWNAVMLTFMMVAMRPLVDGRAALVIATFPPLLINFALGQNGFLIAGLLAILCTQAERRPVVAGVALGVLSFKPHLGLLLPLALLMRRRLVPIVVAFVVVVVLCVLGFLRYGPDPWAAFLRAAGTTAWLVEDRELRVDLMVSPLATLSNLGLGMGTAAIVQYAVSAAVIASFIVAGCRAAPQRLLFGLAITGTFVASPYSFPYDWAVLAVPLALYFQDVRGRGWYRGDRPVLMLLYVAGLTASFAWKSWTYPLPAVSLILFYAVMCRRVWVYGWRDDVIALASRMRRRRGDAASR